MDVPESQPRPSLLFRCLQSAHVAAVVWCGAMLLVAGCVRTPYKSTPGTQFAREVVGYATGVSLVLFLLGAAWVSWSTEAGRSDLLKSSVYLAFAVWVGAILLGLTGT